MTKKIELKGWHAKERIEKTVGIISPPLWRLWQSVLIKNAEHPDPNIESIIKNSVQVMVALNQKRPLSEIKDILERDKSINAFQRSCVLRVVKKFFINPALVEILEKEYWDTLISAKPANQKENSLLQALAKVPLQKFF